MGDGEVSATWRGRSLLTRAVVLATELGRVLDNLAQLRLLLLAAWCGEY